MDASISSNDAVDAARTLLMLRNPTTKDESLPLDVKNRLFRRMAARTFRISALMIPASQSTDHLCFFFFVVKNYIIVSDAIVIINKQIKGIII